MANLETFRLIPPALLRLAGGMWLCCAWSYDASLQLSPGICYGLAGLSLAGTFTSALVCLKRKWMPFALGCLLGALWGFASAGYAHEQTLQVGETCGHAEERVFYVKEDSRATSRGASCWADIVLPNGSKAEVLVYFDDVADVAYGTCFAADCSIEAPSASSGEYCWQNGAIGVANVHDFHLRPSPYPQALLLPVRERAVRAFESLGGDEGALLCALVCNDRRMLDAGTLYDDYKLSGLAHIVAVSGSHLVIIGSFLAVALKALKLRRGVMVACQIVFMTCYLVFSGAPVSAVRAVAVSVLGLGSYFVRRRSAPLNALGVCIVVMLLTEPEMSLSASLFLSAGSSLGIALIAPLFTSWLDGIRFLPVFAREALAMTLASSVATMPYSAALFAQASLVSPFANILAAPLFSLVCGFGVAVAVLTNVGALVLGLFSAPASFLSPLFSFVEDAVLRVCGWFAKLMNAVAGWCAGLPCACVPVDVSVVESLAFSAILLYLLWKRWPILSRKVVAAMVAVGFALMLALPSIAALTLHACRAIQVVMLDVGQGDAILVRSGSSSVLIDTGTNDAMLLRSLARQGIWRLDAVVVTHSDDDHCGSLGALRGVVSVDAVYVAEDALGCSCDACLAMVRSAENVVGSESVRGLCQGDSLVLSDACLNVVWPVSYEDEGGNEDSLCLHGCFDADGDGSFDRFALFTGDAESEVLETIIEGGQVGCIDVLKVGHHGSSGAVEFDVLERLRPDIALISVGADNRYGHPASETLSCLASSGCAVFRTDESGDVSCKITATEIRVATQR